MTGSLAVRKNLGDWIISVAVVSQPVLILLQQALIHAMGMQLEESTKYRVLLTAFVMVFAMAVSFHRKPLMFVGFFSFVAFIWAFTYLFFPDNREFLQDEGLRFLMPVVVPTFIAVLTIKNIEVIRQALLLMSWVATAEIILVLMYFLAGSFTVEKYSMSFSYACLYPMILLYYQKKPIQIALSVVIFFVVLAVGSRGAALLYTAYVALDILRKGGKARIFVIGLALLVIIGIPVFIEELEVIGLHSRTLALMTGGELMDEGGRDELYKKAINVLGDNPVLGVGLYGDRVHISKGGYCHNIVLEILLDYGLFIGIGLLFLLIHIVIKAMRLTRKTDAFEIILILLFAGVLPLLTSGSYLQESSFASFVAYCIWTIKRGNRYKSLKIPTNSNKL